MLDENWERLTCFCLGAFLKGFEAVRQQVIRRMVEDALCDSRAGPRCPFTAET